MRAETPTKKPWGGWFCLRCALPAVMLVACYAARVEVAALLPAPVERFLAAQQGLKSGQVVVAFGHQVGSQPVQVFGLRKTPSGWKMERGPFRASVGRNGFAPVGEKREGDGKTPSGLFPVGLAFGYSDSMNTSMPYRQATEEDYWVDDPRSPDYNRWVRGRPSFSAEKMKRADDLYRHGFVVEYNTQPVVAGHGSAIFFHVWAKEGSPTAGCVALREEHLLELLAWLKPALRPAVLLGDADTLEPDKEPGGAQKPARPGPTDGL